MIRRNLFAFTALGAIASLQPQAATAEEVLDSYAAHITAQDYYNSRGVRLKDAVSILRQDRANFHRFRIRHRHDSADSVFTSAKARATMPALVRNGGGLPDYVRQHILSGEAFVAVIIYGVNGRPTSIRVEIPG